MEDEVDLRLYVHQVWRRRHLLGAVVLIAGVASVLASVASPRLYQAEAMLLVSGLPAETLAAYAESDAIRHQVALKLREAPDHRDLIETLTARAIAGTGLVALRVVGRDPERGARVANLWAETVLAGSQLFLLPNSAVRPAAEAVAPDTPIQGRKVWIARLALAVLGAGTAGAVLVVLLEHAQGTPPTNAPRSLARTPTTATTRREGLGDRVADEQASART